MSACRERKHVGGYLGGLDDRRPAPLKEPCELRAERPRAPDVKTHSSTAETEDIAFLYCSARAKRKGTVLGQPDVPPGRLSEITHGPKLQLIEFPNGAGGCCNGGSEDNGRTEDDARKSSTSVGADYFLARFVFSENVNS